MGKKDNREIEEEVARGEYGKPLYFDPTFAGPLHKRSCTDIVCLLIFVTFIVIWAVVGYIAFSNGDPSRLISPIDSEGNHCGVDSKVVNSPYLLYFDITKCVPLSSGNPFNFCNTPQVCVEDCPTKFFVSDLEKGDLRSQVFCKVSFDKDATTETELKAAIDRGDCTKWYLPSKNLAGHCVPALNMNLSSLDQDILDFLSKVGLTTNDDIKEYSKIIGLISQAKEVGESIVMDLKDSWPYIVGGLVLAMFLCLIYIVLMRWFAGTMVWVSLFGALVLLAYCVYASYTKYSEMADDVDSSTSSNDGVVDKVKSLLALRGTWLVFLIASSVTLVIVLLLVFFLRKRIRIAVALIREASRAVSSITSTLAFPLVPWLLEILVIVWAVAVALFLAASTKSTYQITKFNSTACTCYNHTYSVYDPCTPQDLRDLCHDVDDPSVACADAFCNRIGSEYEAYIDYMHVLNVFGFFWGLAFMSGFGEMVLAGAFATWYWTFKKSDVPFFTLTHSIARTLRYHVGTLAFGSLILAICRMIRAILEYINSKLRKYDNAFVKVVMCCLRCFFWCLEKFIQFINRNAYIMCAIHGKNFCSSAKDAFNLLMRNIIRVFVLDKVTDFLLFLGKLMITAGMVALSFYFFSDKLQIEQIPELKDAVPALNYYFVPVIVIGVGTYFISSLFFGVYAMAVDTLFLCFLEDCERNDGSLEKPYFMSKNLMNILGKKNKKAKQK